MKHNAHSRKRRPRRARALGLALLLGTAGAAHAAPHSAESNVITVNTRGPIPAPGSGVHSAESNIITVNTKGPMPIPGLAIHGTETVHSAESNVTTVDTRWQDSDGDGMRDEEELLAGTDPEDRNSYLRIDSISTGDGGGVRLTWGSVAGRFYTIERTADLGAGFSDLTGQPIPATPPENVFLDDSTEDSAAFFYRIKVE